MTTQNNEFDNLDQTTGSDESFITSTKRKLETREDYAGQAYRTIRDNPRTSAAIATGVAAAAAGAGAFLWNRNRQQREAVNSEVMENNADELAHIKGRSVPSREPQA